MSLPRDMHNQIEAAFKEYPNRFFTEHDIHSELALIATRSIDRAPRTSLCVCAIWGGYL